MRKYFEGLSFVGGTLLFAAITLGVIFRLFGLRDISAWGDELASWYFAQHILEVVKTESHTPAYYLLCKAWMAVFPTSIYSLRIFSIILSYGLFTFCFMTLLKRRALNSALILAVLWSLWPTLVIYDRQARHYALFAELTMVLLIVWEPKEHRKNIWLWFFLSFFQSIHPMGIIPTYFLIFYDLMTKKISWKRSLLLCSSSIPLVIYYGYRFIIQGPEKVLSNISWISNDFFGFLRSFAQMFAGDAFPFNRFYPITYFAFGFIVISCAISFVRRDSLLQVKSKSFLYFFLVTLLTISFVQIVSIFGLNLRISRYYIFSVSFLIFFLLHLGKHWGQKETEIRLFTLISLLVFYQVIIYKPWSYFEWDDQIVERFKRDYPDYKNDKQLVICANAFQLKYYFERTYRNCSEEALMRHHSLKTFDLFDLNGGDKFTTLFLIQNGQVSDYTKYDHAYFFRYKPKNL